MKTRVHAIAGIVGFLTIAVFWTSTVVSELLGSPAAIAAIKHGIVWGMIVLIPAMVIAGGSGMSLGGGRSDPGVLRKKKRMPFIALNGLIVLLPSAIFLAAKANAATFDAAFYGVQAIELIAGAVNLTLMGLNIRDGLRLSGRLGKPTAATMDTLGSIDVHENGPVVVTGSPALVGADGSSNSATTTMALCRCGASKNKLFCDGSHATVG